MSHYVPCLYKKTVKLFWCILQNTLLMLIHWIMCLFISDVCMELCQKIDIIENNFTNSSQSHTNFLFKYDWWVLYIAKQMLFCVLLPTCHDTFFQIMCYYQSDYYIWLLRLFWDEDFDRMIVCPVLYCQRTFKHHKRYIMYIKHCEVCHWEELFYPYFYMHDWSISSSFIGDGLKLPS